MLLCILKLKMRDLAGQALAFVQDLVPALLNFHTYTEQRIQIFPVDSAIDTISPLNQKVNTVPFVACTMGTTNKEFSSDYVAKDCGRQEEIASHGLRENEYGKCRVLGNYQETAD